MSGVQWVGFPNQNPPPPPPQNLELEADPNEVQGPEPNNLSQTP